VRFDNYRANELSLDEIYRIAEHFEGLIWLDIGGGEPFLREDFPDICAKFNTKYISIPTNGFYPKLVYEAMKKIRGRTDAELVIAVSLDGFEKTNDEIRNKGCFSKSIETIKLLKTIEGIKIKVNTVLCKKNYDEIIAFMKFIKKLDIDFHPITFLRGKPFDPTYQSPSYDQLQTIKNDVFAIWGTYAYGIRTLEAKILRNYHRTIYETSVRIMKEKRQIPHCLAWKTHLVVYPEGDVAFCEMLEPIGNLRKTGIEEILTSEAAEKEKKRIRNQECYCYHNCNLLDNFFLNPLQYPKLLKGIWKK